MTADPNDLLDALAHGLMDLDAHKWGEGDRTSLLPHYRRDAERFLLPHLDPRADAARSVLHPTGDGKGQA